MPWSEADVSVSDAESLSTTSNAFRMDGDVGPAATGYYLQQIHSDLPNAVPRIELRGSWVNKIILNFYDSGLTWMPFENEISVLKM